MGFFSDDSERSYRIDLIKKGRRLYGALLSFSDGRKAYFAYRKHREIYRYGRSTISEAMRDGVAGWALDDETLLMVKARAAKYVGVMVQDTGDIYVARVEDFFRREGKQWYMQNHTERGGSLQRVLPLQAFRFRPGVKDTLK